MIEASEIKAIRKLLKLTQKEMAEKVGVDTITVNRWENGQQRPSRLANRQLLRLKRKAVSEQVKETVK